MTFKKETEKIVSLQMKGLVHFYHPPVFIVNKADRKNCLLEFPIAWTHITYTYRKKEFQNISERKLYSWFEKKVVTCSILHMEMNMILVVLMLMEFACIRQSVRQFVIF